MVEANPAIQRLIDEAKAELAKAKAEKASLFPANLHPLAEPDKYPKDYSPEQILKRNQLNAQIESLERRIEELENRKFTK